MSKSSSDKENEIISFQRMPVDVLFEICNRLNLKDLINLSEVRTSLHPVALSNQVWFYKFKQLFPDEKISADMIKESEKPGQSFFWYTKTKDLFKKSYSFLSKSKKIPDRTKKIIYCLIEGRTDELEAMNFSFSEFQALTTNEEIAKKTRHHFNFSTWLTKNYFQPKTANYLFRKVKEYNVSKYRESQDARYLYAVIQYAIAFDLSQNDIEEYIKAVKASSNIKVKNAIFSKSLINALVANRPPELLETLIQHGADVNTQNGMPLQTALIKGDLGSYKYLIEKGANPKHVNDDCLIKVCTNGHLHVLIYLMDPVNKFEFSDDAYKKALDTACQFGQLGIMKHLIPLLDESKRDNLLSIACTQGHMQIINYLETITGGNRLTVLDLSTVCSKGYVDVLKYIIDHNNFFQFDPNHYIQAFKSACEKGQLGIIQYLLPKLQEMDPKKNMGPIITMLIETFNSACEKGPLKIIPYLLSKLKELDPTLQMKAIATEGFKKAASNNKLKVVKYLHEEYSFDNKVLNEALISALTKHPYDVVNFLLQTNMKIEYKLDLSNFPIKDVSIPPILTLPPNPKPEHLDAPPIVVNWKFIACSIQAVYFFKVFRDEKIAATFLDLANLICQNLNTPFETILSEWETSKNPQSQYKKETSGEIISTSFMSSITGFFRNTSRLTAPYAEQIVNAMVNHSKLYNYAKNPTPPTGFLPS